MVTDIETAEAAERDDDEEDVTEAVTQHTHTESATTVLRSATKVQTVVPIATEVETVAPIVTEVQTSRGEEPTEPELEDVTSDPPMDDTGKGDEGVLLLWFYLKGFSKGGSLSSGSPHAKGQQCLGLAFVWFDITMKRETRG